MKQRILTIFTRTPLHVGAGNSVGAIDQPIVRERHTGFPIIPGSSLKGSFADHWNDRLHEEGEGDKRKRVRVASNGESSEAAWLFGSDNDKHAAAGSLIFSEARLLAFPIRSARGSYAWITCPLMLQRAARDGVLVGDAAVIVQGGRHGSRGELDPLAEPADTDKEARARFDANGPLALGGSQLVLEEYCFSHVVDGNGLLGEVGAALAGLVADPLWKSVNERLVILSNGMMSHFATAACEVAQHVRIDDQTGTADRGGLFNQENVPADALFYSVVGAVRGRTEKSKGQTEEHAFAALHSKIEARQRVFQFGADASTGLGFCSVELRPCSA